MESRNYFLYPLVSAVLLSIPWLFEFPGWLLFVGFVPLFLFENYLSGLPGKGSKYVFLNWILICFFLWNLLSAWWLGYATIVGLALFLFLNTFLMGTIWYLYHLFKKRTHENLALVFLVSLWLSFEFLHLNWDIQLPGMTLGGAFGNQVKIVQWYEFTGVLGGSLWILAVNIFIYKLVKFFLNFRKISFQHILSVLAVLLVPIVFSMFLYFSYSEKGEKLEFAVLQPNIDPYTEKFDKLRPDEQLEILLSLIDSAKGASFIIGPETALAPFGEDSIDLIPEIQQLKDAVSGLPEKKIIVGANTKKFLSENENTTITTRFLNDGKTRYEEYNSAVLIDASVPVQIYHKNILVSGVEKVPFARYFGFLKNFFFDLGGTTGGLGAGVPLNFVVGDSLQLSPLICFESMFGGYLGGLIRQGGEYVVVMTNDGWWKKSSGAGLHFSYSRLRAIEMRRSIVRSANTGFSGFINQRGDVLQKSDWWTRTVVTGELYGNQTLTFYARYGDYIGRFSAFVAGLLFLLFISGRIKEKSASK
ncbi:MAG: apolipoprotein N-acyltransferase [Bacteroidetes bacterium GWF2_42_66]|nr:MAG: apolipoprotein N-acyltransferase [Bacteroidetes bacterium GWA2_42_15]OFX97289.1 MAG: apolipoprotein N-acyltransferase [Bacteroidetes bacterium GWE2_42_39]OFY39926.1 MAG: apolipoprotein N-acyltransferase [Bacteroidetes bacterium GWF2_42_66]HBL78110.1 apolipoprotein N-acyltransferase [Prolixibacteraceae bacterium]HCR90365.1 apolipoprotein N-acyltransferase [Prolixibacteraceae bacterium]